MDGQTDVYRYLDTHMKWIDDKTREGKRQRDRQTY